MRYLVFFLLGFSLACSTQTEQDTSKVDEAPTTLTATYQYDSLSFTYPQSWKLTENKEEGGANLISIKSTDSLSGAVISIAVFQAELPKLNTLLSMKGSVYLNLDVASEAIEEGEAKEITYQESAALFQTYTANLATSKKIGQFIVMNKSGRCYVLFFQYNEAEKSRIEPVLDAFEQQLVIR